MNRPAWQVPMMWLVAGLPAMCVLALVALVIVANRAPEEAALDGVHRVAIFTVSSP